MTVVESEQLGALIRRLRLEAGLSQEQLAERSGLSARAVSDLERGQRASTRPETLRMLAEGLALGEEGRETLLNAARPELRQAPTSSTISRPFGAGLPVPTAALIGRDREVADLISRLTEGGGRLTTLTGPGGVGKTRLALEAAHLAAPSFPDGAVFVDLAPVTDPQRMPSAIAHVLAIRESGEQSVRETLRTALRDRHFLLLLDNFEQVIDAAPLVGELLAGAPHLSMLVTSRESLRIRGEEEFVVEPLDLPTEREAADLEGLSDSPAISLFVRTATSARPGFVLAADNASAVVEMCRRLDGLPLAIELAASRVKHFPPTTLLEHLDRRLPVLTGGARDLPARQQTLRDTIAWSYDLLSPEEQALFRRLGIFAGGATIPAIEAVVPAAGEIVIDLLSGLASLVDKSLLRERPDRDGTPRFSMLELIREFALDRLVHAEEEARLRHALAEWGLGFVRSWVGNDLMPTVFSFADLNTIEGDLENIRAAVDYFGEQDDAESSATLFVGLYMYFYAKGRFREAASLGRRVLQLAEQRPIPDRLKGIALSCLAVIETMVGEAARGESHGRQGLQLLRQAPQEIGPLSVALISLLIAVREQGRFTEAMELAEEAYAVADAAGGRSWASFAHYHIGKLAFLQDDLDRAATCLREALDESRASGWDETSLYSAQYLAALYTRRGQLEEAAGALREAESWGQELGIEFAGLFLDVVGALAGRPVDAVRVFGAGSAYAGTSGLAVLDEPWITEVKRDLRAQLGQQGFETAYRDGQRLSLEEALALMHDLLDQIELDARP